MKVLAVLCLLLNFSYAQNDGLQFRAAPSSDRRNPTKSKPLSHPFPNNENYFYYYQDSQQQSNAAPSNSPQNSFYSLNSDYAAAFYQNQFDGGNPLMQRPIIPPQSYVEQFYSKIPYGDSPLPVGQQGFFPLPIAMNPSMEKQAVGEDEGSSDSKNKESSENNTSPADESSSANAQAGDQIPTLSPVSFILPLPTRSATGATFTNAHHYPYPQGLMRFYHQQIGQQPQPSQPITPIGNNQNLQYFYYLPGGSSYPYFPLMAPGSLIPNAFHRGSIPDSSFKDYEGNLEADEKEKNDGSQQTGKASSGPDGNAEDSSSGGRKRIYTYNIPGFSHLGPLYSYHPIPEPKHANSRV